MGSWVHDLGEQESDSSGILTWDMRVTCLGGSHDESVKDRSPRGGIMVSRKISGELKMSIFLEITYEERSLAKSSF